MSRNRSRDTMEQQHSPPLTTEALSETLAPSSNAAVLKFLEQSYAYTLDSLIAPDIELKPHPNPNTWTSPAYHYGNSQEFLTAADEHLHHGIDGGCSIPETSTTSFGEEGSYTNISDQQSQPTYSAYSTYSGSDRDLPFERPEEGTNHISHNLEFDLVQPTQVPETSTGRNLPPLAPKPSSPGQPGGSSQAVGDQSRSHEPNESDNGQQGAGVPPNGGRPKGYRLSKETLENQRDLARKGGSCFRCNLDGKECNLVETAPGIFRCLACIKNDQKLLQEEFPKENRWRFGCIQNFQQLALLPGTLKKRLALGELEKFFYTNASKFKTSSFVLPLNFWLGSDIAPRGMEFTPKGDELRNSPGVWSDESSLAIVTEHTLPIHIRSISTVALLAMIEKWVKDTLNSSIELSRYPKVFLPHSKFCWAADTLVAVCKFYEVSRNSQGMYRHEDSRRRRNEKASFRHQNGVTLNSAFELAILNYVLSSVPYIPPHAVNSVVDNLKEYQPPNGELPTDPDRLPEGSVKCPRMVMKVVKSAACEIYGRVAMKFLGQLTVLLMKPRKGRWGFSFCVMILLLAAVAGTQISLTDQHRLDSEFDPTNANRRRLYKELVYFENQLVDLPMKIFKRKYKGYNPFQSGNGEQEQDMDPAAKNLVESVNKIFRRDYGDPFQLRGVELKEEFHTDDAFAASNFPRLLTKFIAPYFNPPKEKAEGKRKRESSGTKR